MESLVLWRNVRRPDWLKFGHISGGKSLQGEQGPGRWPQGLGHLFDVQWEATEDLNTCLQTKDRMTGYTHSAPCGRRHSH